MIVLGIDTAAGACSAALLDDGRVLSARILPMQRGHQEALAPHVSDVMAEAGVRFGDLHRIGVTVGPGSFTGLRVGLAFAKGLGLALGRPCVGVGTLEALAVGAPDDTDGPVFAVIDARRDQVYLQAFIDGRPTMAPDNLPIEIAAARLIELAGGRRATLIGSGARLLDGVLAQATIIEAEAPDPADVARLAAARLNPPPPRPLYLRAPDAKLPGGREPPA